MILIDANPAASSFYQCSYVSSCKQCGFRDVIAKPYRMKELEEVIERVIAED